MTREFDGTRPVRNQQALICRQAGKYLGRTIGMLTLAAALALSACAQSDATGQIYLSSGTVPTNLASVHTYPDPPLGFNPLAATDQELAKYGFPGRPDPQTHPDHYASWQRAMQAAKIRWHGEFKSINTGTHPAPSTMVPSAPPPTVEPTAGPSKWEVVNAAGVVLNNTAKTYSKASFDDIWTVITVPKVQLPFDNTSGCASSAYFSVSYAGFDGAIYYGDTPYFYPGELAGVMEYVDCGTGSTLYQSVVGWGDIFAAAFYMNPGDIFYTEVHAFGGCNNGSAFVEDLTTLTYNSYTITNPCISPQVGRSAQWVVDRICCNGPSPYGVWPLANTISISFEGAEVENGSGRGFYPGSQATDTEVLTMMDDGLDQAIELVSQGSAGNQGSHSLSFTTTGCAYTGGCVR
jgi:hypothetical protein